MKIAPIQLRLFAFLIDMVLITVIYGAFLYGTFVTLPYWISQLMIFALMGLTVAYFVTFTASQWQGTLGKKLLGLKVEKLKGGRLNQMESLIRMALSMVSSMFFFVGHFVAFFDERRQALHDLGVGSIVICDTQEQF